MTVTTTGRAITYEIGHEIELDETEAARLNANRRPGNYRVVRVDGELAAQIERASQPPRETAVKVSELGVRTADELRGAGIDPGECECEPAMGCGVPLVALPVESENLLPAVEPETEIPSAPDPAPIAAEDEVAPDWATYLAGVSAAEAAEALRTLESADDIQTALDAENGPGGKQRPLVLRAGNAALRRLRATA